MVDPAGRPASPVTPLMSKSTKTVPKLEHEFSTGPLMDLLGYRIRLAQLAVFDDFMRRQPRPAMTPGQFAMLVFIQQNPGITQRFLSERIGIDKSTLTLALDRLVERGLVVRLRSNEDRRSNALQLTTAGRKRLSAMNSFIKRHEERIASGLSETERRQLMRLLSKIRRTD